MDELNEDEPHVPPVGYGERGYFSVEFINESGLGILTVFALKENLGKKTKEELLFLLVEEEIIKLCDSELPNADLTSCVGDEGEYYELTVVLSDEDYVYAECILPLTFE